MIKRCSSNLKNIHTFCYFSADSLRTVKLPSTQCYTSKTHSQQKWQVIATKGKENHLMPENHKSDETKEHIQMIHVVGTLHAL